MSKITMLNKLSSTFIKKDYEMLKRDNQVDQIEPKLKNILRMIRSVKKCDYIFTWWLNSKFAGILGKLFNKPVYYVAGGYDTVKNTEIGYGVFQNPIYSILTNFNLKNSEKVFVVSKNLKDNLINNVKNLNKDKIKVVPTGYDSKNWESEECITKIYDYIHVSYNQFKNLDVFKKRLLVKGTDRYVDKSLKDPSKKYILIGTNEEKLLEVYPKLKGNSKSSNLTIISVANSEELKKYYNLSEKYLLFSRHEGLPNSLIEAIMCGCKFETSEEVKYLRYLNKKYILKNLTIDNRQKLIYNYINSNL